MNSDCKIHLRHEEMISCLQLHIRLGQIKLEFPNQLRHQLIDLHQADVFANTSSRPMAKLLSISTEEHQMCGDKACR